MVLNSFILGMLTVVAVIVVAVIIKGVVRITQLESQLKDVRESMEWRDRDNSDRHRDIFDNIEEQKREITSYVDSRIDKLQSKSKEALVN
jgi:type II secretory pathway pseudopilin PulG